MPTEYWYTESIAPHQIPTNDDDWSNAGGANKNASVQIGGGRSGPPTHDDGTSYIGAASGVQFNNIDWPGPIGGLPSGFTFSAYFRHRRTAGTPTRSLRFGGYSDPTGTYGDLLGSASDTNGSWANDGTADCSATGYNPAGVAWAPVHFDSETTYSRVGVSGAGVFAQVTSVWGQLEYTAPSGGFIWLLGLAGLLATPLVGRIIDFAQFMKFLEWRRVFHPRHTIMTGEEVRQAWEEIRAYRWPTQFEMRAA